jgi:hypothetical protein
MHVWEFIPMTGSFLRERERERERVILYAFNVGPLTFVLILLYSVIITKKKYLHFNGHLLRVNS